MMKRKKKEQIIRRKIIKIGNSYAVTIPPALLKQEHMEHGDTVNMFPNAAQGIMIQKAEETR